MLNALVKRLSPNPVRALTDRPRTPRMLNFVRIRQSMLEASVRSSGLTERTVTLGDDTLGVWTGGDPRNPTLVFLHGFGAHAVWQWYSQVEALARDYHIIMPNLLWFGPSRSERPDFSLEHQVNAVVALLDHLDARRVHLCGLSYGGAVASLLTHLHPERIRSLTLADSPGNVYTRDDHRALCERFETHDLADVFVPDSVEDVQRLLQIGYKRPPLAPRFALRQVLDVLYGEFREEKRALIRHLIHDLERLTDLEPDFDGPIQLIWGREDEVFPLPIAHRLLDHLGGDASLAVIDDTRHAPNLEQARDFNHALGAFLERA